MKREKIMLTVIPVIILCFNMGCNQITDPDNNENQATESEETISDAVSENDNNHESSSDYTWSASEIRYIHLEGTSVSGDTAGIDTDGSVVTIRSAGVYSIDGTLSDGRVIVNAGDDDVVKVILDGATISSSNTSPFTILNADKVIINLKDQTTSTLNDGATYSYDDAEEEEPSAVIFSKNDLTLFGSGTLNINGSFNDGISSKDGLIIASGTYNISAADDGIRGKDYLFIKDGTFTITAGGDGLKSDNDSDLSRGYVEIVYGDFSITSSGDAVSGKTDVMISGGIFDIKAGGGSSYSASTVSAKGVKAGVSLIIDAGDFNINTADDAIHSNLGVALNGGTYMISTADDGIHADSTVLISDGTITITKCYEGVEGAVLTFNGGNVHITASDDGINGVNSTSTAQQPGMFPGGGGISSLNSYCYINGGYIYLNANGDGIDIAGSINMTGGTVIINGPTGNGDGAVDYDGAYKMTGGYLLAVGSSGMAETAGTTSTQYAILVGFSTTQSAGTLVHMQNSSGEDIFTFAPAKSYQSVAFCAPSLKKGETYTIYLGGSCSGTETDGLYSGGTYSPGNKYSSLTISTIVTKLNVR